MEDCKPSSRRTECARGVLCTIACVTLEYAYLVVRDVDFLNHCRDYEYVCFEEVELERIRECKNLAEWDCTKKSLSPRVVW